MPGAPMKRRLLIGSVLAILLGAIGAVVYLKTRDLAPEALLARLPSDNAAVLSIDFAALRRGGIFEMLSGPVVEEEPEYKTFVEKTAFDYRRDLDHAFISFHPSGVYFLVRGRFDWKRLEAYAREQGGGCSSGLCRMPGSAPERSTMARFCASSSVKEPVIEPWPLGIFSWMFGADWILPSKTMARCRPTFDPVMSANSAPPRLVRLNETPGAPGRCGSRSSRIWALATSEPFISASFPRT